MASLVGKRIVVIGDGSGIGLGVSSTALQSGADVVVVGRSAEKLRSAERTLRADGRAAGLVADMTREADVAHMFDAVGAFDHLVSTAGTLPPGDPIDRSDIEAVRRFVDNKLIGAVILAKHAARTLRTGGSMTFTSGINKDRPPVPGGSVVAAIAGSFGYFGASLVAGTGPDARERRVAGWVDTPMWDIVGNAKPGMFAAMADRLPSRRIPTASDVARAYLYLMESEFTTGETIRIDGGQALI